MVSTTPKERIREQLRNLSEARAAIIEQSTSRKLERLTKEESQLREAFESILRVEATIVSNSPQSPEETQAWNEIKDLMERESQLLRERFIPEKFIRPDALEHFESELLRKREPVMQATAGLQDYQRMSRRDAEQLHALESEERAFPTQVKPVCLAGQKLFAIRQAKKDLSALRDELKAEREAGILAAL